MDRQRHHHCGEYTDGGKDHAKDCKQSCCRTHNETPLEFFCYYIAVVQQRQAVFEIISNIVALRLDKYG